MKNSVFLRSYFLFKEKLVARENIQLFHAPSERSQVSGGSEVWAFLSQRWGYLFWMKPFDFRGKSECRFLFLPSLSSNNRSKLTVRLFTTPQGTRNYRCRVNLATMNTNKESKKIFFILLNSLETEDMIPPRLEVKWTCGNIFTAADLIEILMKYFLTRLRRSQKPSAVVWWQFGNC